MRLGGMMIGLHGWGKFASLPEGATSFPDPLGIGSAATLTLTVFAEFFCSVFVIFGVGTRLAAVPLLITMLVAGFIHHADDPFSTREKALLYGIGFLVLVFTGPGPWSVEHGCGRNWRPGGRGAERRGKPVSRRQWSPDS